MCLFSYVRAVSQAVPGWSTARNVLALREQRDFITLRFLCDLYVHSWKVWNRTRDDSTYCWKTTQRVVSTFHPTRSYCFVFTQSFFVFIRHTSLSSMYILRWIQQWGTLNSKLNPGEVQLYKSAEIRSQSDEMYILLIFFGPYWGRPIQCRRRSNGNLYWVMFIDFVFCLFYI